MSNARCLTEGVDVPAVDMVAFLSPRRSRVDIVQATGRAMRRSPGKTMGYVLVPLYVELATGETVQAAVNRAEFDEVWDVLNSLQEQDDVLAELIRYLGEQKGRGKGFDDSRFADRVDIVGIQIGLEALRSAVTTRCFESLFSSWDTFFGKLVAFKERFGHCNVETLWEEDLSLARWVTAQRTRRTKGALTDEQVARLDGLGFVWNWQEQSADENWLRWFQKLKLFKERFGHCNVDQHSEADAALGRWVSAQRTRRNNSKLYPERIRLLDELGFVWDFQAQMGQQTWMKWYRELETYARENGNPHVPARHANTKLASWVWIQRSRRDKPYQKYPPLRNEQVALLEKLGFHWDARDEQWAARLEQLKHFKEQHGHCEVGLVAGKDDDLLGWVRQQRSLQARGKLDIERKAQLDALGFPWTGETNDRRWDEMYEGLKNHHAQDGNADVPSRWNDDPKLAVWVREQRHRRKKHLITDEQVRLLDELRFTWQHRERGSWDDRLVEVAAFKVKNGHCEIPVNYPENPKLGGFVNAMRTQRNSGKLSAERIAKLDALGFVWESSRMAEVAGEGINAAWKRRFDELLRYRQTYGGCDVPAKWHENSQLGNWVSQQRQNRKSGTLHPERQQRLDEIGFDWRSDSRKEEWAARFEQLKAYKGRFGNCRVPVKWKENPQLGMWVTTQRQHHKNGRLSPEKERLLREIGFE